MAEVSAKHSILGVLVVVSCEHSAFSVAVYPLYGEAEYFVPTY